MTEQAPDYSFERGGLALSEWLWRLLNEDRQTRAAAGDALQTMETGRRSIHSEWPDLQPLPDFAAQRERFEQAVRSAVGGPDFDTADFVRKLVAHRLALKNLSSAGLASHRIFEILNRELLAAPETPQGRGGRGPSGVPPRGRL